MLHTYFHFGMRKWKISVGHTRTLYCLREIQAYLPVFNVYGLWFVVFVERGDTLLMLSWVTRDITPPTGTGYWSACIKYLTCWPLLTKWSSYVFVASINFARSARTTNGGWAVTWGYDQNVKLHWSESRSNGINCDRLQISLTMFSFVANQSKANVV